MRPWVTGAKTEAEEARHDATRFAMQAVKVGRWRLTLSDPR